MLPNRHHPSCQLHERSKIGPIQAVGYMNGSTWSSSKLSATWMLPNRHRPSCWLHEWSQIGTVQAVSYIEVRSPTKGHSRHPISFWNRQPLILVTGADLRDCTVQRRCTSDGSITRKTSSSSLVFNKLYTRGFRK